jgi:hypothetical protein
MRIMLLAGLILACVPKSHFSSGGIAELNSVRPWIPYLTMTICPNERTTITLYNRDSTVCYTLFDNIITKEQTLVLMGQPEYWKLRSTLKDRDDMIVVPMPPMEAGVYYFAYSSATTTFVNKFLF